MLFGWEVAQKKAGDTLDIVRGSSEVASCGFSGNTLGFFSKAGYYSRHSLKILLDWALQKFSGNTQKGTPETLSIY